MINFREELQKYQERIKDEDIVIKEEVNYKNIEDNIEAINKELSYIILNANNINNNSEENFEEIKDDFEKLRESFEDVEDNIEKIEISNKDILIFLQDKWWGTIEKQNSEILFLKREIKTLKERENRFQKALMKILDSIEWINKYMKVFTNDSVENTVNASMKVVNKELSTINISTIGVVGELFDENIHNCIDTIADENREQYEIFEVVKKGYMFKGQVLRTAQVIVVSNEEE